VKNLVLIVFTLASFIIINGCTLTSESIKEINQKIENRYNSFSTAKYKLTASLYENGVLTQKEEYTELIKKPDKRKQFSKYEAGSRSGSALFVCNGNTAYSQISPNSMDIYEYVNLLPGMISYGGYFLNKGLEKWKIPMEITDEAKYKVETSEVHYNGKNAIKAVVTILMSEEAKPKQFAIGSTPRETVVTYWFDSDTLAILKEESHSFGTKGEAFLEIGGQSTIQNGKEIEIIVVRIYEEFYFDIDIPDSEFEINPADYPGVEFRKMVVDTQEKFK
jgi:outer membrane lipoprotein-sorting protein